MSQAEKRLQDDIAAMYEQLEPLVCEHPTQADYEALDNEMGRREYVPYVSHDDERTSY